MDEYTLKKLQRNPHYKLSDKQRAQLASCRRNPMVDIGTPQIHNNKVEKHPVEMVKRKVLNND